MTRKLRKLFILLFIGLLIISYNNFSFSVIEATEVENVNENYMSADEFFLRLEEGLNIDLSKVSDYGYCSKSIGYLVDNFYIDSYTAHLMTIGEYSAYSFIDKGLKVCGVFDRPLDTQDCFSNVKQVAIDIGLISSDSNLDLTKKLTFEEAEEIIEKLIKKDFKKVEYTDNTLPIKYKLYDFNDKHNTYNKVSSMVGKLPKVCIDNLNKQGYTLHIVDSVTKYHPNKHKEASAFISYDNKSIFIQKGNEDDLFHEVGHFMLNRLSNKKSICDYLYKQEGLDACSFSYIRYEYGAEELICDAFSYIFMNSENEERINRFKESCPKIYWIITEGILNTSGNRKTSSISLSEVKKVVK